MPHPSDRSAAGLELALAQAGWLRALARRMVADAWRADDLAQATWLRALEHPPPPGARVRAWLAAVLRNVVRSDARARARQSARELVAARGGAAPPAAELAEDLALQRELLEAVDELAEPYRSALVARFYRGESVAEIARRTGEPSKTVETRLRRGTSLLRRRLDRGQGRRAWLPALCGWLGRFEVLPIAFGVFLVETKVKLVAAAVVAAGALLCFVPDFGTPSVNPPAAPRGSVADAELAGAADRELAAPAALATPAARSAVVVSPREDAEPSTAGAVEPKRKFRGRVEDVGGAPAPHLGIWLHRGHVFEGQPATSAAPLAVSLADGRFELEELDEFGWLEARAPGWITVLSPALVIAARPADAPEPAVIVARSRAIAGDVLDEDGLPVAGAAVGFTLGRGLFREPGRDLAAAEELDWSTESGADGRFAFADAPEVDGVVAASAEGYEPAFERLLAAQSPHVTLVLSRRRAEHATVRGTVVDELGRPIEDALVALGIDSQHTSADGRFAFDVERRADDELLELEPGVWQIRRLTDGLRAVARGRLPVALPLPGFAELVHADPRDLEFTLVLARTSLSIAGRVLEPGGAPAASAYVAIRESTRFGREVRQQGQSSFAFDVSAEGVMSGQGGQTGCLTDDAGRFELDGLLERDYEITVFDPATLRMIMAGPFAAGTDTVEITLSGREELGRIAGRLVSARGLPVAGANLIAGRDLGAGVGPMLMRGFTTDDDGRFECAGVVLDDLVIQVEDARLIPTVDYRLADGDDPQALEIRVALRCPLQVDLEGAGVRADAFSVVGSGGEPLQVVMSFGGMFAMVDEIEFHGVRSEVVGVPESAVELVLRLGGAETARVPIAPRPGEVTIVRL